MIPICSIAGREYARLPQKLSSQADALLEQESINEGLEQQIREEVEKVLGVGKTHTRWEL